jgi:hypothetical protein
MHEPYRLAYPGTVLQRFRRICARAKQLGNLPDVMSAAKEIDSQLRTDPQQFGDPCYSLSFTRQTLHVRAIKPLIVHYSIHQTKRIVVVRTIDWMLPIPE